MDFAEFRARLHAAGALSLRIKVIPRSPRTEAAGLMADGTLKVKVAAVPEKGKANAELCAFLARQFDVHRACVTVVAGETSHNKVVRIEL